MKYDVFLSYNWGADASGRDNHHRVSRINEELKKLGYRTWLDTDKLFGDITEKIINRNDQANDVIIFVKEKYHEKVNGRDQNDEISHEFRYATTVKKMSKIITVVMEKDMLDTEKWRGLFGFQLHGNIYVDMSGEFYHEPYLNQQMKLL